MFGHYNFKLNYLFSNNTLKEMMMQKIYKYKYRKYVNTNVTTSIFCLKQS